MVPNGLVAVVVVLRVERVEDGGERGKKRRTRKGGVREIVHLEQNARGSYAVVCTKPMLLETPPTNPNVATPSQHRWGTVK